MTETELSIISDIASEKIPGFTPNGPITPVDGGLLNQVWRLDGNPQPIIVKHAPPYIATNHEIPLDPERQLFEARALGLFRKNAILHSLQNSYIKVPELKSHLADHHILLLEDAGVDVKSLNQLSHPKMDDERIGTALAEFIAGIHARTTGNRSLAQSMENGSIQKSRYMIQYQPASRYLLKAGIPDYESLGRELEALGRQFMKPGKCLIMGDLWPRSLLWNGSIWYLIDWEFSHYGSPAQDTGHLLAHLWMLEHRSTDRETGRRFSAIKNAFIKTYQEKIIAEKPDLISEEIKRETILHAAAEVIARTTGAFQKGYLYAGLEAEDPTVQEAVRKAAEWIRGSENANIKCD